jgi:enterochelin esterase-like enzyme
VLQSDEGTADLIPPSACRRDPAGVSPDTSPVPPAAARSRVSLRTLGLLASGVWLAVGLLGVYQYVRQYSLYRGFSAPVTPNGVAAGRITESFFYSPALRARRSFLAYLPAGYAGAASRGRRFPVLYLLHAPPGRPASFFSAGALAVDADVLAHAHRIRPLLIVVPNGKSGSFGNDTEWANARAGRYEDFVLDVVRAVDRRYATLRDRRHRVIGGLSAGGYGAVNIGLHHLHEFGGIQSWSGYFLNSARYSPVFAGASAATIAYNSPTKLVPKLAPEIRRLGLRAFLYSGLRDHEPGRRQLAGFAALLRRAGARTGSALYPGGHDWGLWRSQARRMLQLANDWFASGEARR